MSTAILRGDARHLPLPDGCVDLIVTSPPYFGLRSYTDGGVHYDGQVGSEATPAEYVAALVECTREWVRVLKPEGSLFVNLGDKYSSPASGQSALAEYGRIHGMGGGHSDAKAKQRRPAAAGFPPKSLLGLPWRYALAAVDQLGLILRAEIIWAKPNGLPESVTDRVRRAHEQVFHLVKQPRYYSAVDEIREAHVRSIRPNEWLQLPGGGLAGQRQIPGRSDFLGEPHKPEAFHLLGKLPGSVWTIPSQPLTVPDHLGVDHFAAFPMELPRRIILGWSPPGICTACGQGRRPVSESGGESYYRAAGKTGRDDVPEEQKARGSGGNTRTANGTVPSFPLRLRSVTGYACACPDTSAPTRPAVVVDPFGGTGTTALLAHALGRHGLTVDLSMDYCRLAAWRTSDPGERARALEVPKPPPVSDDQLTLFNPLSA